MLAGICALFIKANNNRLCSEDFVRTLRKIGGPLKIAAGDHVHLPTVSTLESGAITQEVTKTDI